jgi:hypothetical protein
MTKPIPVEIIVNIPVQLWPYMSKMSLEDYQWHVELDKLMQEILNHD